MSFTCPECLAAGALSIISSITLPPDSRSDDILLQTVRCGKCGFQGAAIYEESRRGSFESESWDHRGYKLNPDELSEVKRLIKDCPARKNQNCGCASHRALGRKNDFGRWQPPFETDWQDSFPMRRS